MRIFNLSECRKLASLCYMSCHGIKGLYSATQFSFFDNWYGTAILVSSVVVLVKSFAVVVCLFLFLFCFVLFCFVFGSTLHLILLPLEYVSCLTMATRYTHTFGWCSVDYIPCNSQPVRLKKQLVSCPRTQTCWH